MSKLEISTRVIWLSKLLKDFEEGKILIPPFQRDFVCDNTKKIELLDSLNKGFPIGSVLFWMPEKNVRENFYEEDSQLIGGYKIKNVDTVDADYVKCCLLFLFISAYSFSNRVPEKD